MTGRFINADKYISTGQGLVGTNVFAYCANNPATFVDIAGEFPGLAIGIDIALPMPQTLSPTIPAFPEFPIPVTLCPYRPGYYPEIAAPVDTPNTSTANPPRLPDIVLPYNEARRTDTAQEGTVEPPKPRSPYRPAERYYYDTKKDAYEGAKKAGGGRKPRLDPPEGGKPPHYHPNVPNKQKITPHGLASHDHYFFPRSKWGGPVPKEGFTVVVWD